MKIISIDITWKQQSQINLLFRPLLSSAEVWKVPRVAVSRQSNQICPEIKKKQICQNHKINIHVHVDNKIHIEYTLFVNFFII